MTARPRIILPAILLLFCLAPLQAQAQLPALPDSNLLDLDKSGGSITINLDGMGNRSQISTGLKVLALMTVLSLAPAILIMLTSFTRIVIVLSFVKRALTVQEAPPQQIIVGLALFLT